MLQEGPRVEPKPKVEVDPLQWPGLAWPGQARPGQAIRPTSNLELGAAARREALVAQSVLGQPLDAVAQELYDSRCTIQYNTSSLKGLGK
jgi:hypothetical protein